MISRLRKSSQTRYVSTLCGFWHDVKTGEPIAHACVSIPQKAVAAERRGDYDRANDVLREGSFESA